jgi:hypothetical protein
MKWSALKGYFKQTGTRRFLDIFGKAVASPASSLKLAEDRRSSNAVVLTELSYQDSFRLISF